MQAYAMSTTTLNAIFRFLPRYFYCWMQGVRQWRWPYAASERDSNMQSKSLATMDKAFGFEHLK